MIEVLLVLETVMLALTGCLWCGFAYVRIVQQDRQNARLLLHMAIYVTGLAIFTQVGRIVAESMRGG